MWDVNVLRVTCVTGWSGSSMKVVATFPKKDATTGDLVLLVLKSNLIMGWL